MIWEHLKTQKSSLATETKKAEAKNFLPLLVVNERFGEYRGATCG